MSHSGDDGVRDPGELRIALREDLLVTVQSYRGRTCYVIEDPAEGRFYRVGLPEGVFLSLLDGSHTLRQAMAKAAAALGEEAFSEPEAMAILHWLVEAKLACPAGGLLLDCAVPRGGPAALQSAGHSPADRPSRSLAGLDPALVRVVVRPRRGAAGRARGGRGRLAGRQPVEPLPRELPHGRRPALLAEPDLRLAAAETSARDGPRPGLQEVRRHGGRGGRDAALGCSLALRRRDLVLVLSRQVAADLHGRRGTLRRAVGRFAGRLGLEPGASPGA